MKSLLQAVCFCLLSLCSLAQNVTILPSGITPAGSSWPSLSYEDILALPAPQKGNMAIDLTFDCLRFYNGKKWVKLLTETDSNMPSVKAWSEGGIGNDRGEAIAVDSFGNIYVTGTFDNTITIGNTTFTDGGQTDIFIAKYNKNGELLWAKKEGQSDAEGTYGITVDANGNVFIAGYFYNSTSIGNTTLTSAGNQDFFVAKYSTNGVFQWVQKGGGNQPDLISSLVTDANGNVYVGGYFRNTATFNNISVVSEGLDDIFLAKYASTGDIQWVRRAGGPNSDKCGKIAIDMDENIYMTGSFQGTVNFGNITITGGGFADMFIAKCNTTTAAWEWVKRGGGGGNDYGKALAISVTGDIIVAGTFEGTATFGTTTFISAGPSDIVIARYNNNGVEQSFKKEGGTGTETPKYLGIDANDNIYLIGDFYGIADFSGIPLTGFANSIDGFIAKYKSNNTIQWAQRLGGSTEEILGGATVQANGNIYLTGYFNYDTSFGNMPISGAGNLDVFIVRVRD
ncbi:SBBP repeat-containing protein [Emticicia sp. C21]|uniref:SBBP repeat-containing protein n=1 Tax=Emticicia sp. C21 TaxID=2302915 RepID=UPI000E357E14|nr:SBBP repeat-containing protein [Emticicia sp. C21]RFS17912.1 hypothetical protein D0T08_01305 [Emticicia sp. C21]